MKHKVHIVAIYMHSAIVDMWRLLKLISFYHESHKDNTNHLNIVTIFVGASAHLCRNLLKKFNNRNI